MPMGGPVSSGVHIAQLACDIDVRIELHRNAHNHFLDMKGMLGQVLEEKEKVHKEQQEIHAVQAVKEELSRKNQELELELVALKEKLEECESRNRSAELQPPKGSPANYSGEVPQNYYVRTRGMQKRQAQEAVEKYTEEPEQMEEQSQQELMNRLIVGQRVSKDELEEVRRELINGFLHIDTGGRIIGIKRMGELNKKPFQDACRAKRLHHDEAHTKAAELCYSWQQKIQDPLWHPFKTITVDGNHKEVLNDDDEKLRELKSTWGEDIYDAVVNGLMEMNEYNSSKRCVVPELWNYKERKKASLKETIQYLWKQVKDLKTSKRRARRGN